MPEFPVHEMTVDALAAELAWFETFHPVHASDDDWYKLHREGLVSTELQHRFSAARNADPGMNQVELERWRDRMRQDDEWIRFQRRGMERRLALQGASVLRMPIQKQEKTRNGDQENKQND